MNKPYIPQPCHEDWNAMTPKEKGRFCDVCAKVVVDFTKMSDDEVIDYFQQHTKQKTCGHFRNDQLLQKQKIYIDLTTLPKNIPFKNVFVACFISFFSSLFFVSCHGNTKDEVVGEIAIVDSVQTLQNDTLNKLIDGAVEMTTGEPMPTEDTAIINYEKGDCITPIKKVEKDTNKVKSNKLTRPTIIGAAG